MGAAPVRNPGVTGTERGGGTAAPIGADAPVDYNAAPTGADAPVDDNAAPTGSVAPIGPVAPTQPAATIGPVAPTDPAELTQPVGGPTDRARRSRRSLRLTRRTWPVMVVVVLVVVWVFVAEPLRVTSVSMEPSLRAGQHVLVDKISYRLHRPRRDDFIVFPQPGDGQLAVKRVVGVPGDTVALEDGVLVVNGISRREPYVDHRMIDSVYFGPKTVPENSVFVMGDNRGSSIDSRSYGPVEVETIVGRIIWST